MGRHGASPGSASPAVFSPRESPRDGYASRTVIDNDEPACKASRRSAKNKITSPRTLSRESCLTIDQQLRRVELGGCNGNADKDASKSIIYIDEAKQLPIGEENKSIYVSILKQLLGEEMRKLIREELQSADSCEAIAPPQTSSQDVNGDSKKQVVDDELLDDDHVAKRMMKLALSDVARSWSLDEGDSLPDFAMRLIRQLGNFGTLEAPNQPRLLKHIIESNVFNSVINAMIVLNCVFMVYSLNHEIVAYLDSAYTKDFYFWCEVFFLCIYSVEFALKIVNYRQYYFFDIHWKHNVLDFILLVGNAWSVAYGILASGSMIQNFTWMRILRLLRLVKALRVLTLAEKIKTLRAILTSLLGSFWTLLWSLTMLSVCLFVFSLVFVSRVANHFNVKGINLDPQERASLLQSFGSVGTSMESLIMDSLGGRDWGEDYVRLGVIGSFEQCIFLFFTFFIQVALMNVILGIFVEEAMKNLKPDPIQKAHDLFREEIRLENELRKLCKVADKSNTGRISNQEWSDSMEDGRMREFLEMLGFSALHVHEFFQMLLAMEISRGGEEVTIEHFVRGCMRLRGSASSFDMNAVLFEILDMKQLLAREMKMLRSIAGS